ncbi:hypothetical protein KC19_2G035200 [Ceratodon purpureus]|uniref:Uncharacterized protein n=1 Tax=Ceratodon purpureus TaxID=3225 RepID=A0A8T0ISV6_CERPU|nr:hypothetical protein KC19_2G035200 [Ceratodon purpureus]
MQQQGGNPGSPRFPNNPNNPNARPQFSPFASPVPRPGPPTWQGGPPPGPQFRPHVPGPAAGPPGGPTTIADALQKPISPLQPGAPSGYRPGGPPMGFQPSQPAAPVSAPQPPPFGRPPPQGAPPMAGPPGAVRPPPSFSAPNLPSMGAPGQANSQGSGQFLPPGGVGGGPQGPGYGPPARFPAYSGPPPPSGVFPPPPSGRPSFSNPPPGPQFGAPPQQGVSGGQYNPMPQSPTSASIPPPPLYHSLNPPPPQFGAPPSSQGFYSGPPTTPMPMSGQYADGQAGAYSHPPPAGSYGGNYHQVQGLVEDFQSLALVPVMGSPDSTVDPSTLPRPLDGAEDVKPVGNLGCHPRYLRLTTNAMPNAHSLVSRWHLPLGAVTHPLAEAPPGEEVPVVNFVGTIVRCRRCRTYINAYVMFTDGGRRWRCNVCSLLNEVPVEYFSPLDENGRRRDADERPELSSGSVEFVAPTEYMVRPPMPPVYFFLIDVSLSAVKSGMVKVAADTIKASLDKLPGYPRTQIGFITFDSTLHFYNLKSSLTQPQMMVVADLEDPFLPLPDDLLVNLSESRTVVEALLDSLPAMFENNLNIESALGPALKATFMVMSQLGGKLLVFQSTLPSLGFGRLKLRGDDPRMYGTEKEHQLRGTEEQFYKQMAADFSKFQIGVNIYAFSERYTDLASLGVLAKYTGGQVCYYPAFHAPLHGEKFSYDLARDLSRETAWEAVMRIRCGKGIRFSSFHGHFMLRSSDLMALPAVDCDKAFAMQLVLEDTLLSTQTVYFQVALLYTSSTGERRIRVHTMATPVVNELSELYRAADVGAIASLMSRLAVEKTLQSKLEDSRQATQQRLVRSLREYRNLFSVQNRTSNRLIYPESLKLLPLYTLGILKNVALRGGFGDCSPDERSAMGFELMTMSIPRLLKLLYPSLLRLDEYLIQGPKAEGLAGLPSPLALSSEKLDPRGAYLLDDGLRFVLWLGKVLPPEFVKDLLGPEAAHSADFTKIALAEQESVVSQRLLAALNALRESCPAVYQICTAVRQGEQPKEGTLVLSNLLEDRTAGASGYADFVVQIYRQVSQKTS